MDGLLRILNLPRQDASERARLKACMREGANVFAPSASAMLIWAVVTAAAMVGVGLSPIYVLLINATVYAASAQLAVLSMLMLGAGAVSMPMIWLTAFVVNLRFVFFSGSIKPFFRHLPLRIRLLYGFLNTDLTLMVFLNHFKGQKEAPATSEQQALFFGLTASCYVVWQTGSLLGVLLAAVVPKDWGLSLAASLTMLVLIVKMVDNWAGLLGCVSAALTAVFVHDLPHKLWVVCAIAVGVTVAVLAETWFPSKQLRLHEREVVEET